MDSIDFNQLFSMYSKRLRHIAFSVIHELKEKEIACKLQLPASMVKNRLYRGRKRLIEVLSNKYPA